MPMQDIAADEFPDGRADQDVGREMIQTSDARKADRRGQAVGADYNQWFVAVLMSDDTRKCECGGRVARRK